MQRALARHLDMLVGDMKEEQMSTLAELQERIAELQLETDSLREAGREDAIAKVREVVVEYGLTPKDIFGRRRSMKGAGKRKPEAGTQSREALHSDD